MTEIPQTSGDSGRDETGKFIKGHAKLGGAVAGSFSLKSLLRQELQKCPEGQDKYTFANMMIRRQLKEAIESGDIQQIRLIWNYVEDMPKQPQEFSGKDGQPIEFTVNLTDKNTNGDNTSRKTINSDEGQPSL